MCPGDRRAAGQGGAVPGAGLPAGDDLRHALLGGRQEGLGLRQEDRRLRQPQRRGRQVSIGFYFNLF